MVQISNSIHVHKYQSTQKKIFFLGVPNISMLRKKPKIAGHRLLQNRIKDVSTLINPWKKVQIDVSAFINWWEKEQKHTKYS